MNKCKSLAEINDKLNIEIKNLSEVIKNQK